MDIEHLSDDEEDIPPATTVSGHTTDSEKEASFLQLIEPSNKAEGKVSSKLPSLEQRLYQVRCTKLGVIPVSTFIRQCDQPVVTLKNVTLGPRGAMAVAAPLMISTTITDLNLQGCDIQALGMKNIAECLTQNYYMKTLGLAQNNLSSKGAEYVCQLIMSNATITSLDLSGNHFGDSSAKILVQMVNQTHTLQHLDLSNNELGIQTAKLMGPAIAVNEILTSLNLSWNMFRLKEVSDIAMGLKENIRLTKLDLSYNGAGYDGAKALGDALKENGTLTDLDLTGCNMVDKAVYELGQGLRYNEGLQTLSISHNPVSYIGASGFLGCLAKNENLTLQCLKIHGIIIDSEFSHILSNLQQIQPYFTVQHDVIPIIRNIQPITDLFIYLWKAELEPRDIFNIDENDLEKGIIKHEDFCRMLKSSPVPLSPDDISFIADHLASDDKKGMSNISILYEKWKQFKYFQQSFSTKEKTFVASPRQDTGVEV